MHFPLLQQEPLMRPPEARLFFLFIALPFLCLPFWRCQNASDSGQLPCRKMWTERSRCSLVASGWQKRLHQGSCSRWKVSHSSPELLIQKSGASVRTPAWQQFENFNNVATRSELLCIQWAFLSLGMDSWVEADYPFPTSRFFQSVIPPVTATKRQTSPSWTVGKTRALLWDPCLLHNTTTLSETHCCPPFSVPPGVMIC